MGKFHENLIFLMQENDATQEDVANIAGVSQAAVYKWLQGSKPGAEKTEKLARFFRVDHGWLIGARPDKTISDYVESQRAMVKNKIEAINKLKMDDASRSQVKLIVEELGDALILAAKRNAECAMKNDHLRKQLDQLNRFIL